MTNYIEANSVDFVTDSLECRRYMRVEDLEKLNDAFGIRSRSYISIAKNNAYMSKKIGGLYETFMQNT